METSLPKLMKIWALEDGGSGFFFGLLRDYFDINSEIALTKTEYVSELPYHVSI